LPKSREHSRFTQDQKHFLTEKFKLGEGRTQKPDPRKLAEEMRNLKLDGSLLFTPKHFLNWTQVASYFSKLAKEKKKPRQPIPETAEIIENAEQPPRDTRALQEEGDEILDVSEDIDIIDNEGFIDDPLYDQEELLRDQLPQTD
jgi:hypothetical protein